MYFNTSDNSGQESEFFYNPPSPLPTLSLDAKTNYTISRALEVLGFI